MKNIVLLGASGSIGTQTIDVVLHHSEKFRIIGLSVGHNIPKLKEILSQVNTVRYVSVADAQHLSELEELYPDITFYSGDEGLVKLAKLTDYDIFVDAVVGFRGLLPCLEAINNGKDIALANKESLVAGGPLVKEALKRNKVRLYPIDSEHSAILQCLQGNDKKEVDKLIVTASGGSFRDKSREELKDVTVEQALKHPNWSMGAKITIDSASMMNKGLEIIEAHHLYGLPLERIGVLVHPQSLVHSLVEFEDGSLMAQAGTPDMRMPIAYCLAWPLCLDAGVPPLDLARSGALTFEEPDLHSFPCLELACRTIGKGSALPVALNAANEVAVEAFLSGRIGFMDIPDIIGRALDECSAPDPASLEAIETLDHETRLRVGLWIEKV